MSQITRIALAAILSLVPTTALAGSLDRERLVIHVSPDGVSTNDGSEDAPVPFRNAIERITELCRLDQHEGREVLVLLHGGRYTYSESFDIGPDVAGSAEHPIRIAAKTGDKVIFDGGVRIAPDGFAPVTDSLERGSLAASAREFIVAKTLTDPLLIERFRSKVMLTLTFDDGIHRPSVFPNEGYAFFDLQYKTAEASPPGVPDDRTGYGVRAGHEPFRETGKPMGWLGTRDEPRGAHAGFAESEPLMAGTWEQWTRELNRDASRTRLIGFIDANWLQKTHEIVGADAENRTIHLASVLAYGWNWKNRRRDKPFKVFGLLCELDQPGEWHFDTTTNRLYLYMLESLTEHTQIGLPYADGFLKFDGCSFVEVENIHVVNVGKGTAFDFRGGTGNRLLGCSVRNSTATGAEIRGTGNGLIGCDLVDLDRHIVLRGGTRSATELNPGDNLVENCHLYQKHYGHQRVNISVSGVGNRLRHNLIHNSLGQSVTVSGNDHVVEYNELFNIGYEEGDGGAIYAGADLAGYGTTYRYNFFHHLMHVPGKVERSGIHLDDLQAGSTCIGNVFYKSASKAIFMNGGAGHTLIDNVCLEGFRGIFNDAGGAAKNHARQMSILQGGEDDARWKLKENYVGRVEQSIGSAAWNTPLWADRYPLFAEVMNDSGEFGRMWPIRCTAIGNAYYGNTNANRTWWNRTPAEAMAKNDIRDDRQVTPDDFVDYDALDLRFKSPGPNLPKIQFERAGLYTDEYRPRMPSKLHYRRAVKAYFDGIPSHPGTAKHFDSAAAVESAPMVVGD